VDADALTGCRDHRTSGVGDPSKLGFSEQVMNRKPHELRPKLSYSLRLVCLRGWMGPWPHVRTLDSGRCQSLEDRGLLVDLDWKLQRRCSAGELRERSRHEVAKLVKERQVVRSPSGGNFEIRFTPDDETGGSGGRAERVPELERVLLGVERDVPRATDDLGYVPPLAQPALEPRRERSESATGRNRANREWTRGDDGTAIVKA
jgi:hypothetical protein